MCRRSAVVGLALLWSVSSIATAAGCRCPRGCGGCGNCMQGYAACGPSACDDDCDRYAARPYHHVNCRAARRDPRIPGPRSVSTLPAPEMAAPSYFHPVPTYPVFGPRSEQPDGIEPALQPLLPGESSDIDGEPLPPPSLRNRDMLEDDAADDVSDDDASDLKLAAPRQTVEHAGWKPAKKHSAQTQSATRPCAKCTVTFRERPAVQE